MSNLTKKQQQFRHHLKVTLLSVCSLLLIGVIPGALNEDLIFKIIIRQWYPDLVTNFSHPTESFTHFLLWITPFLVGLFLLTFLTFKTIRHLKKEHNYQLSKFKKVEARSILLSMPNLASSTIKFIDNHFIIEEKKLNHENIINTDTDTDIINTNSIKTLIDSLLKINSPLASFFINLNIHLGTLKTLHLFYESGHSNQKECNEQIILLGDLIQKISQTKSNNSNAIEKIEQIEKIEKIEIFFHHLQKNISMCDILNVLHKIVQTQSIIDISSGSKAFTTAAVLSTLNNGAEFSDLNHLNIPSRYAFIHQSVD